MPANKKRMTEYDLRHGVFSKAFLKKHSQIVYAIILIFLIPSVIIGNTLFTIHRFGKNIDERLRRQALVIAELFDTTAFNALSDVASVQTSIDRMLEGPDELRSFDVMVPDEGAFRIVASSIPSNIDTTVSGTNTLLAWSTDDGIAHLSHTSLEDIRRDSSLT